MRILGIDPGVAIVGYGVIEYKSNQFKVIDYGKITTPAHTPLPKRLKLVYDGMTQLVETFKPDVVAIAVGHARGVLVLGAENAGVPVSEYTPLQIKQAVTGYGRADKNQVQQMVKMFLNLTEVPKPDDTADALAVAICHAHSASLSNKLGI